jgi:hypothetical protein
VKPTLRRGIMTIKQLAEGVGSRGDATASAGATRPSHLWQCSRGGVSVGRLKPGAEGG